MDPFCRTEYERGTRHLLRRGPAVFAARFCSEGCASAGEFFYISKLVSTPIKAESVAGVGAGRLTAAPNFGCEVGDFSGGSSHGFSVVGSLILCEMWVSGLACR